MPLIQTYDLAFTPDLLGGVALGGARVYTSAMLSSNGLMWSSSLV